MISFVVLGFVCVLDVDCDKDGIRVVEFSLLCCCVVNAIGNYGTMLMELG